MNDRYRNILQLALAVLLLVPVALAARADLGVLVPISLSPEAKHQKLDQAIAGLLSHYHYRQASLDDRLSEEILDAYLEALDPNRLYFLGPDIRRFDRDYRTRLDDALQAGDLGPAYDIFNVYQRRVAERTTRVQHTLAEPFDFDTTDEVDLDRKTAPWAADLDALDRVWYKRLKNEVLALMLVGQSAQQAGETLNQRYQSRLRRALQSNSEDVFQTYMNAVARSFDPHTAYFSPRASENFNIQMRLSLEGIGTVLRMEEEQITVLELVPGGPADLSRQLRPGDRIIGVGQGDREAMVDVVGWRLDDVVDLIRGPRDSVVRLRVIPDGSATEATAREIRLVRDTIRLEKQAARSEIQTLSVGDDEVRVGIITVPTFYSDFAAAQRGDNDYRSTTRDVRRILRELDDQNVDAILVDLRQNGGGSLQEAVEFTGLFIPGGPVVQVRNARGDVEVERDPDPDLLYSGPLAVMVDRFSASASEIFAAAIQDYGRGLVMGDPTFGKGTVQTLVDLGRFLPRTDTPLGQLKLTIAKFYRISGGSTQHRGIIPDLRLPSPVSAEDVGESAHSRALPWDEITPVSYRPSGRIAGLLSELRVRHEQRMRSEPAYQALLDDFAAAETERSRTRYSLNERERRAQRDHQEREQLARENRLRTALGLEELSLEAYRGDAEELPDLLLQEGARITADLVQLLGTQRGAEALVMSGQ